MLGKYLLSVLCALSLAASAGNAADKATFVKKATEAGDFEIASSRLALEKAESQDVKKFAQQMIDDHTLAAQKLESVAAEAGMPPEKQPLKPTDAQEEDMKKLELAKAGQFDEVYVNIQRKAHETAIKLFKDYAQSGDNAQLKRYASDTLPVLESHRDHLKTIAPSKM